MIGIAQQYIRIIISAEHTWKMRIIALSVCLVTLLIEQGAILDREYYKVLGVAVSATQDEIKEAYRRLSRKYHPDRKPNFREKFQKINVAYEVLSNDDKKYLYDRLGKQKMDDPNIQQEKDVHALKGQNIRIELALRLQDLYAGVEIESAFFKKTACPHCLGSGAQNDYDVVRCSECNGQGKKSKRVNVGGGYYNMVMETCPRCQGSGKIIGRKCETCKGSKIVSGVEELTVKIPPGTRNYDELRYINMGDEKMEGAPGDLVIVIREAPHSVFTRYQDRLHAYITISLQQALFGFTRTLQQLDGRSLTIDRKSLTQPGQVIVMEGEGMPIKGTDLKEDMHVEVQVMIPQYGVDKLNQLKEILG